MKVCVSQVNPTVADLRGNTDIIIQEILVASQENCDVVVLPELVTTAYPPRDYLYQDWIWDEHENIVREIKQYIDQLDRQITVIFGGLHQVTKSYAGVDRYNAAYIIDKWHSLPRIVHKRLLPQYDVFDESRYFTSAANEPLRPIPIFLEKKGSGFTQIFCDVLICEDIWNNRFQGDSRLLPSAYDCDPIGDLQGQGPIFVLNGSPFWHNKFQSTSALIRDICLRLKRPVCWVNQVGAQDDIVMGGYSMAAIHSQSLDGLRSEFCTTRTAGLFREDRMIIQFAGGWHHHDDLYVGDRARYDEDNPKLPTLNGLQIEEHEFNDYCNFMACVLHVRDYMRRTSFKRAVFGASGGIDSAVVGSILAHAIGGKNVTAITMPSKFSSSGSISDAELLAKNCGMTFLQIPIGDHHTQIRRSFLSGGQQEFRNKLTDENIQPRLRAVILMTYSNDNNALLITTGNKSEITVGYCTLYGDTCGGIGVIGDLWKTEVYRLARFINKYCGKPIPEGTITKPPSAELKPDQQDTDSLPSYDVLDPLLMQFVEQELPTLDSDLAQNMYRLYLLSEYKRSQMPLTVKLKSRSFGTGRRIPITAKATHVR